MFPGLHPMAMMSTAGMGYNSRGPGLYGSGPTPYAYQGSLPAQQGAPAADTQETTFLYIPNNSVGAIIGTKGSHIRNIIRFSGATVKIAPLEQDKPADQQTERKVTIVGSPESQWKVCYNSIFILLWILIDSSIWKNDDLIKNDLFAGAIFDLWKNARGRIRNWDRRRATHNRDFGAKCTSWQNNWQGWPKREGTSTSHWKRDQAIGTAIHATSGWWGNHCAYSWSLLLCSGTDFELKLMGAIINL